MRRALAIVLSCCLLFGALPSLAAPSDNAQEAVMLASQAKAKFVAKQFREAAKLFMDAFAKVNEPTLVFNAARSYEDAGALREALPLFELFLSLAPASDVEGRQDAQEHRASIAARLQAEATPPAEPKAQAEPKPPAEPKASNVAPSPVVLKPAPVVPKPTPIAPKSPASAIKPAPGVPPTPVQPARGSVVWPVLGVTGLALVVTGAVVRGTAGSALADIDERLANDAVLAPPYTLHPSVTQRELDDAIASRDRRLVAGGWLIGVGVATTATAAVLWWRERPTTAWVQPMWSPEATGVAVAGRF